MVRPYWPKETVRSLKLTEDEEILKASLVLEWKLEKKPMNFSSSYKGIAATPIPSSVFYI